MDFNKFSLMNTETVKLYAVQVLKMFDSPDELKSTEIGDGNINYVFRVWSEKDGRSVIVKQADKYLRSSGRPLDIRRNKIEAGILKLEGKLAPGFVPEVYYYDEIMAATSMEDVSAYGNLRKELAAGRVYPHLTENISEFMADTLLPTTDVVMDRAEKKEKVGEFINPELCDITEDLVLTEPYNDYKGRNIITPGMEDFVKKNLYDNCDLQAEVAFLRDRFMNYAQALLHGDLHSGSIFANEAGIKVLDPEFAFYGPMGYDIGNVIGNFFFSLADWCFVKDHNERVITDLKTAIENIYDLTRSKLEEKFDESVTLSLYRTDKFKKTYIDDIMADSLGYAGTEIIRRTVGDSKVSEISSVKDLSRRIPMEKALISTGIFLIMKRRDIRCGRELTEKFCNTAEEENG